MLFPLVLLTLIVLLIDAAARQTGSDEASLARGDRSLYDEAQALLNTLKESPDGSLLEHLEAALGQLSVSNTMQKKLYETSLGVVEHHRTNASACSVAKRSARMVGRWRGLPDSRTTADILDRV